MSKTKTGFALFCAGSERRSISANRSGDRCRGKLARSTYNPLLQLFAAGFTGSVYWRPGHVAQLIISFLISAPSPQSYRKYALKPLSIMSCLLSFAFCLAPETAKAILFCLRADELGSFPSRERSLLQVYLNTQFGEKIKKIVRINTHYFLIPTSEEGCKRCFYRLVFVDDKVTDVAILVGTGSLWAVPEVEYPYLGNHYTGFTIGGAERSDIYVQVPNADGSPMMEIQQRNEMNAPRCKF